MQLGRRCQRSSHRNGNFGDLFQPEDPFSRDLREGTAQIRSRLEVLKRHCETEGRPYDEILRTHFVPWLMVAPTEAEARDKFRSYFGDEMPPTARGVVLGTPERIIEWFRTFAAAGVDHFICRFGSLDQFGQVERFARDVLPALRSEPAMSGG